MVERCGELRLAKEALSEGLVRRQLGSEELQRDLSLEPEVIGPIDHAHAATADSLLDAVTGEDGADPNVGDN
jgi:hypothetical protein